MVIKNAVLKRITAILLAVICIFSFSIISSADEAINDDIYTYTNTQNSGDNNSYKEYYAKHPFVITDGQSITIPLDGSFAEAPVTFNVNVPSDGCYNIGMSYMMTSNSIGGLEIGIKINGEYPFAEAEKLVFPHMWKDESAKRVDGLGNEFASKQVNFDNYYFNLAKDISNETDIPYIFYFNKGVNEISLIPLNGEADLEYFELEVANSTSEYQAPDNSSKMYNGENIVIEGEKPYVKSSYWLSPKNDNSSINVSPRSTSKSLINYIGGDNWKTIGETIVWETPELEEGYYQIGTSFRQSTVIGGKVYRKLLIDGKVPFTEAEALGFVYDDNWQSNFFADNSGTPYLIYLSKGKHRIGMTVVPGPISQVQEHLQTAISEIGSLYIDMTMIVGESVDIYRDYALFEQIPNMDEHLNNILKELNLADDLLQKISGRENGSNSSVIKNMKRVIMQMTENRYTAHRYKSEYYNRYSSLAAILYEMQNMPLDIDKLVLTAPGKNQVCENAGIFNRLWFSVEKFVFSFLNDYNNFSEDTGNSDSLTIWVNWGRDQVQVLNSLIQTSFTPETDVPVNVKLVNASIVQAVLSGKGPDCILQRSRTEPVDLAMRGVLYDLSQFDDLDEVLTSFQEGAENPYRYKDGLYGLPNTQTFFLMFYRNDILKQLNVAVPKTWEEFEEAAKIFARNNLNVWIPNNIVTDINQASTGIGSINIFPTMLMQKGLNIYSADGRRTNLTDVEVLNTFNKWTDMYRKLKLPTALDFYNRFRTGTCPIGISNYTLYTTLKAAAPEIDGLWSVTPIPGTQLADGSIDNTSAGSGTACSMLKETKNPENAWRFLKWWTSKDIQLAYSNEVEAVLGPTGRIPVANVEAFKEMEWDADMLESILSAWNQVEEYPEYPGSYYVSRSLYQGFWNVVENNKNPKDMLIKYSKQADTEMARKWEQYENRKH